MDNYYDKKLSKKYNCNIKVEKELGRGCFGVTYKFKKCILKVQTFDLEYHEEYNNGKIKEFDCMKIIYNKLYKILPNHVIKPIYVWTCSKETLNPLILKSLTKNTELNYLRNLNEDDLEDAEDNFTSDFYLLSLFDKLGNCTLWEYAYYNIPNEKIWKEIFYQILIYLLYLRKYTNIRHDDLHTSNIILKKNSKVLCYVYKFGNKLKYISITPKFIAFPIDFGECYEHVELASSSDLGYFWYKFKEMVFKIYYEFFSTEFLDFLTNCLPITFEESEKLLKHKIFSDIVSIK
jgi:hypothetical protein